MRIEIAQTVIIYRNEDDQLQLIKISSNIQIPVDADWEDDIRHQVREDHIQKCLQDGDFEPEALVFANTSLLSKILLKRYIRTIAGVN